MAELESKPGMDCQSCVLAEAVVVVSAGLFLIHGVPGLRQGSEVHTSPDRPQSKLGSVSPKQDPEPGWPGAAHRVRGGLRQEVAGARGHTESVTWYRD